MRRSALLPALGILTIIGCASDSGAEFEELGVARSALTVDGVIATGTCSSSGVTGLSNQILAEMSTCLKPGFLVKVPTSGKIANAAIHPYLIKPAYDALLKAAATRSDTINISSMFRTIAQQYVLWRRKSCFPAVASPGTSNHETGIAIDVSDPDNSTWRSALTSKGFRWLGSWDRYHFDYVGPGAVNLKGLDVLAFQRLWNRNHPGDRIAEDGAWGPATESRLRKSPATGFPIGADCSGGDSDGDGIVDSKDNCDTVANKSQLDTDKDGKGDACDGDDDNDGVLDAKDNCPLVKNADQKNTDGDTRGDACDTDDDNDGVLDTKDNCPLAKNATQADLDGDGKGDACDDDVDGDGVLNAKDNCARVKNADQKDTDGDGKGDACEVDDDNDGTPDATDNCPRTANEDQTDTDGDGKGDACDDDLDGDGVPNATDNCASIANADQKDGDGDNLGDVCDDDPDGDEVPSDSDNCPGVSNEEQFDSDGDGIGDACDDDLDGDGVPNATDTCPELANPDQGPCEGAAPDEGDEHGATPEGDVVGESGGCALGVRDSTSLGAWLACAAVTAWITRRRRDGAKRRP